MKNIFSQFFSWSLFLTLLFSCDKTVISNVTNKANTIISLAPGGGTPPGFNSLPGGVHVLPYPDSPNTYFAGPMAFNGFVHPTIRPVISGSQKLYTPYFMGFGTPGNNLLNYSQNGPYITFAILKDPSFASTLTNKQIQEVGEYFNSWHSATDAVLSSQTYYYINNATGTIDSITESGWSGGGNNNGVSSTPPINPSSVTFPTLPTDVSAYVAIFHFTFYLDPNSPTYVSIIPQISFNNILSSD